MSHGHDWAILVAVKHDKKSRPVYSDEKRTREMHQLLTRASAIATPTTTLALVEPPFQPEWLSCATELPQHNILTHPAEVHPLVGITHALRAIRARDAHARVVLIPADHCAAVESSWVSSARGALSLVEDQKDTVYLLHDNDRAISEAFEAAEEFCSTTVIVGSVTALVHLSEGSRPTRILDWMSSEAPPSTQNEAQSPAVSTEPAINLVHIRFLEEYTRIQSGHFGTPASQMHLRA